MIFSEDRLPTQLRYVSSNNKYGHKVCIIKGGKVLATGESSLSGSRYLTPHFGRSCHAEINACKQLGHYIKGQLPPQA